MSSRSNAATNRRSLWHPIVDFLGLGGLSVIIVVGALFLFPATDSWFDQFSRSLAIEERRPVLQRFDALSICLLLTILINHPHFIASYRLLYRSREQTRTYRWASVGVPIVLAMLSIVVLLSGATESSLMNGDDSAGAKLLTVMNVSVMVYLGWHYNMQAWGVICTYLFLGEIRMKAKEKWMIKSGLFVLVAIHALLWLASSPMIVLYESIARVCVQLTPYIPFVVFPFFIAGGLGFYELTKRTGKPIPLNAIVPWFAVYVWYYGVMNYYDIVGAVVFVQLAHALQYLVVTTRVEANVGQRSGRRNGLVFSGFVYFLLLAGGYIVFELPDIVGMQVEAAEVYGSGVILLVTSINLHHFFVDGAIWKISNPEVRRDLFSHLERN